jgi:hypothetical protein
MADVVAASAVDLCPLIDDGARFSELQRVAGSRLNALRLYANHQAKRYGAASGLCALCSKNAATAEKVFTWRAPLSGFRIGWGDLLLLPLGVHRITLREAGVSFQTHHAVCATCHGLLRLKRAVAVPLRPLGLLLAILGAGITLCGLGLALMATAPNDRDLGWIAAIVGTPVTLLGVLILWVWQWLRNPRSLRKISRRTFSLVSVQSSRAAIKS